MASNGKKRTTMAKLNREQRLRTKRVEKAARRAARKLDASDVTEAASDLRAAGADDLPLHPGAGPVADGQER